MYVDEADAAAVHRRPSDMFAFGNCPYRETYYSQYNSSSTHLASSDVFSVCVSVLCLCECVCVWVSVHCMFKLVSLRLTCVI